MTLSTAFGFNQDAIRTKSFEYGGHTFKVKIPLTAETEAMFERMKNADQDKVDLHFAELSKPFLENKDNFSEDQEVEYKDDDIVVKGFSLRETAKNKALTELRVTELFRLLVPESKEFDMSSISYKDIEETFPFSVQMELVEEISKVISPNYSDTRKK